MRPPTTALFGAPRTTPQPAARRATKKAGRVRASVLTQCDRCGCTDDTEDRLGRERHEDCGGTFRMYGVLR